MPPASHTPTSTMDLPTSHLVLASIIQVTAAMRKNSRWANASAYTSAAHSSHHSRTSLLDRSANEYGPPGSDRARVLGQEELMAGFVELRRRVQESEDLPPLAILVAPFLSLIRSPLTTGPITSHALTALLSLLQIFPPASSIDEQSSQDLISALSEISSAVTSCKFEASDSQGDEVVLLKMLGVIGVVVDRYGGGGAGSVFLGDKEVCEMLETGLGMCCQMRLSELLRRTAETTVQAMVRTVFNHLKTLKPPPEEPATATLDATEPAVAHMDPAGVTLGGVESETPKAEEKQLEAIEGEKEPKTNDADAETGALPPPSSPPPFTPYGGPTATELIRVLITLLNPSDQQHTDSMRLAALGILNCALEVAGTHVGKWGEMRALLSDEGCKYLFQLTRSDSPNLLASSLRTVSTLFATMREQLKPQLELFLIYLIDRLTPPPSALRPSRKGSSAAPGSSSSSAPGGGAGGGDVEPSLSRHALALVGAGPPAETRDLLLEALAHLARGPTFLADLWANYDCDMEREDLFERTVEFLTRSVYPHQPGGPSNGQHVDGQTDAQAICLHILLASVNSMAERIEKPSLSPAWPSTHPSPNALAVTKERKRILLAGAAHFNQKPKLGLAYLEEHGLLPSEPGPERSEAIARMLRTSPKLDKRLLGDYLSRPANAEILTAFMKMFHFKDQPVAEAMRDLLEAFRLPGESQQISQITETFAEIYFASGPAEIKTQDAVYVLAYSIIMLNTDLYNPQNRARRMTFEDYRRNLRGVNDNADFSDSFLQNIYDSIKRREIILPEEHTGQFGFDYAWKELLARAPKAGPMLVCDTNAFDKDMFAVVSKQVVSAIAYAFTSFNEDYAIQRAITGFRQCATLAGRFKLPEVFDHIVMALSQTTGLLDDRDPSRSSLNNPVVEVEGQALTVSALSVRFGLNFKSQLAAVVLFTIANGNGDSIREGWSQIFEMYQTLFLHSLLPQAMLQTEDFLGGTSTIPLQVAPPANTREDSTRRSDSGLLSTLSSYLLSPYGSSTDQLSNVPKCTDDEIEATLSTVDCLGSCRFEELYSQVVGLDLDSLLSAVRALKDLADARVSAPRESPHQRQPSGRNGTAGRDSPAPSGNNREVVLLYDPASVFLLEMLVSIASRAKEHVTETWPIVFEHLSLLLSSAGSFSILLIERAVVGLLRLCVVISTEPSLRDQLYVALDLLRSLPPPVIQSVSEQLMGGVAWILEQDSGLIKSQTEWSLVLVLVRAAISHPEASKVALALIERILAGELGRGLTADNFAGIVAILGDFAGYGGVSTAARQQRGRKTSSTGTEALEPAVERALRALDALYELRTPAAAIQAASPLSPAEVSRLYWLPPLRALGAQLSSASRDIRQRALLHLQRSLPGPTPIPSESLCLVFDAVLFPTIDELLRPQTFLLDPQGMEETRLRACALTCRVFLVYLSDKTSGDEVMELWMAIVDCLDRLMNSGKPDQLYEAVPESLKNLLLVLHSTSILLPPITPDPRTEEQLRFWSATFTRIERFLPTFLEGLFPPEPTPSAPEEVAAAVAPVVVEREEGQTPRESLA